MKGHDGEGDDKTPRPENQKEKTKGFKCLSLHVGLKKGVLKKSLKVLNISQTRIFRAINQEIIIRCIF